MKTFSLPQLSLVVVLLVATAAALAACGSFHARPDLRTSTLTQPDNHCVKGHKARQVGTTGAYGTPVVEVTDEPCQVTP